MLYGLFSILIDNHRFLELCSPSTCEPCDGHRSLQPFHFPCIYLQVQKTKTRTQYWTSRENNNVLSQKAAKVPFVKDKKSRDTMKDSQLKLVLTLPFWNHGFRTSLLMRRSCHSTSPSTPLDWDSKGPENSILSPSSPCQNLELSASLSMLFYELKKGDKPNHAYFLSLSHLDSS